MANILETSYLSHMRIRDPHIQAFAQRIQGGQTGIDDQNVLELLAAVGDTANRTRASVLEGLQRPGISRREQFELVKGGLSAREREDIRTLLDESGFRMAPGAKNFLEALVDRAQLTEAFGPLTILGDQKQGISGVAKPGDRIEAINLTTAPDGRLHLDDTMEIGRADATGKFTGRLPDVKDGDIIRVRTRGEDGKVGDWVTVRANLGGADTRNALFNLTRVDVAALANGMVEFNQNTPRPISEPGAKVRFTNLRTRQTHDFTVNDKGGFAAAFALAGRAGDEFSVAVSDGTNNKDFRQVVGNLKVPVAGTQPTGGLADPAPLKSDTLADGTSRYKLERYTGPLYIDGPSHEDVQQGAIGNCYFPAALAAVALTDPQIIRDMLKDNGDGTYTVRFFNDYGRRDPVYINVDADLYSRAWGGPIYGAVITGSKDKDKMELWYPLIEKAYAQWKGGYERIGNGGNSGQVMSEVTGSNRQSVWISGTRADQVFAQLKRAMDNKWPATASTYGKDEAARYTNSGVYANHAYSVLGVEEVGGEKFVKLRNPWGQSEPGFDGKNDGIFKVKLDVFTKLYQSVAIAQA